MADKNYLPFVTPGFSYSDATLEQLIAAWVSWGLMDDLPEIVIGTAIFSFKVRKINGSFEVVARGASFKKGKINTSFKIVSRDASFKKEKINRSFKVER